MKVFDVATGSGRLASGGGMVAVSGAGVTLMDTNTSQTATNKTFTNATISGAGTVHTNTPINVATLAGAGTTAADAAAINTAYPAMILATGGNNSVGIILPVAVAGMRYVIKNDDAANGVMKVYPQVNSKINSTANTALSMAANTCCEFVAFNSTCWVTNKVPC
jgi:hypothetical protein